MLKHKNTHIESVNKRNSYSIIYLKEKPALLKTAGEITRLNTKYNKRSTEMEGKKFQVKISGIEQEMKKIEISLNEFLSTLTLDFNELVKNLF